MGSIFGILGLNGSGKTTLCHAICKLIPIDQGKIEVNGVCNSANFSPNSATFGSSELHLHFTALENIQLAGRLYDLCPDTVESQATMHLKNLGLDDQDLKKNVNELSLGTKAKVAFVRALIIATREGNSCPILVLDEPTNGLDDKSFEAFRVTLQRTREAIPDLTVLIATNAQRERDLCDSRLELPKIAKKEERTNNVSVELQVERCPTKKQMNPFRWRSYREVANNPVFVFILLFTLLVPNLFPILNASKKSWMIFVASSCGIYFTWIVRSSFRVLSREQYFKTLNIVLNSKYRGLKHLFSALSSNFLNETLYWAVTSLTLGIVFALHLGIPAPPKDIGTQSLIFGILFLAGVIFSYAIGIFLSHISFAMVMDNGFYLLNMAPLMVIMASGLYYPSEDQPFGIAAIAKLTPYTPLGDFLRNGGSIWNALNYLLVSLTWLGFSLVWYIQGLKLLYKAKRLTQ